VKDGLLRQIGSVAPVQEKFSRLRIVMRMNSAVLGGDLEIPQSPLQRAGVENRGATAQREAGLDDVEANLG
jgi:hypothetical protein